MPKEVVVVQRVVKTLRTEGVAKMRRGTLLATLALGFLFLFTLIAQATTFTVNSTADPGDGVCNATECTLREAINAANANPGQDTIAFNIPGAGPHTIRPTSALPTITDPVIIDGYTQPGASPNTNPIGSNNNAMLKIQLNGELVPPPAPAEDGLVITAGGSIVRGMGIYGFPNTGLVLTTNGNNAVQGNFIHSNINGGIDVHSSNNIIGGTTPQARNVFSGSATFGIQIIGSGNLVQGNYIGTNFAGNSALPNEQTGIWILQDATDNVIGGTSNNAANIIAFNGHVGVFISNQATVRNAILGNFIFSNTHRSGIDLGDVFSVTPNDPGDVDTGPNNLQNFPELTSATSSGGSTTIQGTLNSTANTTFRVEFFANTECDPSGYGEGERFIGFTNVTTDGNGDASFNVTLPTDVPTGQFITSTATDPDGNTSEFSACRVVTGGAVADLSITKVASPDPVLLPGPDDPELLTYRITVTNNGPSTATNVVMTDTLPPTPRYGAISTTRGNCTRYQSTVTCLLGSLDVDVTAIITISIEIAGSGTYTNTAIVTANENDPNLSNNTVQVETTAYRPVRNYGFGPHLYRVVGVRIDPNNNDRPVGILEEISVSDPPYSGSKIPLIVVHGVAFEGDHISCPPESEAGCEDLKTNINKTFGNFFLFFFADASLQAKFDLFAFRYNSNNQPYKGGNRTPRGVDSSGKNIISLVNDNGAWFASLIANAFRQKSVAIIAYSMGGLVSLSAISEYKDQLVRNNVQVLRIITLDTPFHGTPLLGYLQSRTNPVCGYAASWPFFVRIVAGQIRFPGFQDLSWRDAVDRRYRGNVPLKNLQRSATREEYQKVIAYSGYYELRQFPTTSPFTLFWGANCISNLGQAPSDGAVPTSSSAGNGLPFSTVRTYPNYDHSEIVNGKADGFLFNTLKEDLLAIEAPACSVSARSSPTSVTYRPTATRASRMPIRIIVTNNNSSPQTITNITPQAGEPFTIVSISPRLPLSIPSRRGTVFTVQTERAAGLGTATATAPYFDIALGCGAVASATEPRLLVPLASQNIQLRLEPGYLHVETYGDSVTSVRFQLFDLSGRQLIDKTNESDILTIPLLTSKDQPLANGVYLYVVRVRGFNGEEYVSEVRKLVILR